MQPDLARIQIVREWLTKAQHDVLAAEHLSLTPELFDTAVYHCQQSAEKALKGFLVLQDIVPPRTHDLAELADACSAIDGAFNTLDSAARTLAPYAVQFRYPDAAPEPADAETREAVRLARSVYDFVQERVQPAARL